MWAIFFIADLIMTSNQISSIVIQFGTARCHALLELHSVQEWTFISFKEHETYFLCYKPAAVIIHIGVNIE